MTLFMRDQENIQKGIEQGIEQGIRALVLDNIENGFDREKIVSKLIKRFELSRDRAETCYDKYAQYPHEKNDEENHELV